MTLKCGSYASISNPTTESTHRGGMEASAGFMEGGCPWTAPTPGWLCRTPQRGFALLKNLCPPKTPKSGPSLVWANFSGSALHTGPKTHHAGHVIVQVGCAPPRPQGGSKPCLCVEQGGPEQPPPTPAMHAPRPVPCINYNGDFVLAEPIHGTARNIAGTGTANPTAIIRAVAMMLQVWRCPAHAACRGRLKGCLRVRPQCTRCR